jgi:hypothetical protein
LLAAGVESLEKQGRLPAEWRVDPHNQRAAGEGVGVMRPAERHSRVERGRDRAGPRCAVNSREIEIRGSSKMPARVGVDDLGSRAVESPLITSPRLCLTS